LRPMCDAGNLGDACPKIGVPAARRPSFRWGPRCSTRADGYTATPTANA